MHRESGYAISIGNDWYGFHPGLIGLDQSMAEMYIVSGLIEGNDILNSIEDYTHKELVDLLNKCWMTHDGMWFFHCLQEFGIETANRINKASIKSLSEIEIKRIKSLIGMNDQPIRNFEQFKQFFIPASNLLIPDFMNVEWAYLEESNVLKWKFNEQECFAFKGVTRLGVIDTYECGVLFRVQCWLDELGISYNFDPEVGRCEMHLSGKCAGSIHLGFN